jgi:hypothetical protein
MSNVICRKCGWEADSKCIHSRNIFPIGDDYVNMLRNIFSFTWGSFRKGKTRGEKDDEKDDLVITITRPQNWNDGGKPDETKSMSDMLMEFKRTLNLLTDDQIKKLCCQHAWTYQEGCGPTI